MRRIKFGKYAGLRIRGGIARALPEATHLDRAEWLTSMVESDGMYGSVFSADGTGMTASIGQLIAVYPRMLDDNIKRNDQGPLWKFLWRLGTASNPNLPQEYVTIMDRLYRIGWHLSPDGKLYEVDGSLVTGKQIRHELTGAANGVMPQEGKDRMRAEWWATSFHNLFAAHATFKAQHNFTKEHFAKRAARVPLRFCLDKHPTLVEAVYAGRPLSTAAFPVNSPIDLAMAMYWSHSVNAPGKALRVICKALNRATMTPHIIIDDVTEDVFAVHLIKALAKTKYGRWHWTVKNGRYQRTRKAAKKVWPARFFTKADALMPKSF